MLELPDGATLDDARRAHRELIQVWHPDRHLHNAKLKGRAEAKSKQLNAALDFLQTLSTTQPFRRQQASSFSSGQDTRDDSTFRSENPGSTSESAHKNQDRRPPHSEKPDHSGSPHHSDESGKTWLQSWGILSGVMTLCLATVFALHKPEPHVRTAAPRLEATPTPVETSQRRLPRDEVDAALAYHSAVLTKLTAKPKSPVIERSCIDVKPANLGLSPLATKWLTILLKHPKLSCDHGFHESHLYFSVDCDSNPMVTNFGCGSGLFSIIPAAEPALIRDLQIKGRNYSVVHLGGEGSSGLGGTLVFETGPKNPVLIGVVEGIAPDFSEIGFKDLVFPTHDWEPNCCPSAITTRSFVIDDGELRLEERITKPNPDARWTSVSEFYSRLRKFPSEDSREMLSPNLAAKLPPGFTAFHLPISHHQLASRIGFETVPQNGVRVDLLDRPREDGGKPIRTFGTWITQWNDKDRFWELSRFTPN